MKWLKRILLSILALALLAVGTLYAWSATIIGKEFPAERRELSRSTAPDVLAEGERLAQVFGCANGCHGRNMEGTLAFEAPFVGRFYAPSLTAAVRNYTPGQFEALVRQGVRPDGSSLFGMPSDSFSIMADEHLSAVYSYISSVPDQDDVAGETSIGPLGRLGLIMGEHWPAAARARQPW
ncbi:MAG: hypothetical protein R3212_06515, partial [Xanthomonadales bacterium]|nr:hypothetical protein [Xanthomonadales bacterium]